MRSTTPYRHAFSQLRDNDLILRYRHGSLLGIYSASDYSHAMKFVWFRHRGVKTAMIMEWREWRRSRLLTLHSMVRDYPGQFDVFRPTCRHAVNQLSVRYAVRQTGKRYSAKIIAKLLLFRVPGLARVAWKLDDPTDLTLSDWDEGKVCSTGAAWCDRKAARTRQPEWDPVPELSDRWIEPGMLAHSGSYNKILEGLVP